MIILHSLELGMSIEELLKDLDDLKYICWIFMKIYKCIHAIVRDSYGKFPSYIEMNKI